ncbi:MAG: type II secretion system protein [Dehalococcoidia bacterium]|nr:type II secretion system protein [Dehalococcoidia bacterium]
MNRSRIRIGVLGLSSFRRNERGATLAETLVALAIFGIVAVVFLSGLTISSKAVMVNQERVAAESLAKSQMEYVRAQGYDASYSEITIPDDLDAQGYDVGIGVQDVHVDELQKITVTIDRGGDILFTLVGYMVNR